MKKKSEPQTIKIATSKRGKKKMVTVVMGLSTCGKINLVC